ncbi:unnamed protein product [Rangifer tarandus platyrhynchus]|uniref:SH2 domain-containing protein n=1 Tax=Rangifer tarandus platyrhynchus TaxID=3082113 RepID=A0ABN8YLK7_RANTA|nr:unnamed protein product [Rangifer tarandus platyrhynchus]
MSPKLGQSLDLLGVSEYEPHPCWGVPISLPTSHLPLLLHRTVFCLLWRNEWSEILNWKKCSRHTFDSPGPHGSYLLREEDEPDYAFVMSLVLPTTPRDGGRVELHLTEEIKNAQWLFKVTPLLSDRSESLGSSLEPSLFCQRC